MTTLHDDTTLSEIFLGLKRKESEPTVTNLLYKGLKSIYKKNKNKYDLEDPNVVTLILMMKRKAHKLKPYEKFKLNRIDFPWIEKSQKLYRSQVNLLCKEKLIEEPEETSISAG